MDLARHLGVPVQSVLLAAHFKVLSTVSGQRQAVSLCYAQRAAGNRRRGAQPGPVSELAADCLEMLEKAVGALDPEVAAMNAASMEYRGYPLAQIQQDVGITFSEVLFNYTHFHVYNDLTKNTEQTIGRFRQRQFDMNNFDLLVDLSSRNDDRMCMALMYKAQVFDEELMERVARYYVRACEQMLEGLDREHQEQTLLSGEEVEQLLLKWNETGVDYRAGVCA